MGSYTVCEVLKTALTAVRAVSSKIRCHLTDKSGSIVEIVCLLGLY